MMLALESDEVKVGGPIPDEKVNPTGKILSPGLSHASRNLLTVILEFGRPLTKNAFLKLVSHLFSQKKASRYV